MSTTGGGRGEVGFSQDCLCPESDVTLISTERKSSAQSDDELKQKALKRIIAQHNNNTMHLGSVSAAVVTRLGSHFKVPNVSDILVLSLINV